MESWSRLLMASLACGAAGPAAAGLVIVVAAPTVVGHTAASDEVGSVIAGIFLAGLALMALGGVVGLAATAAALTLTRCPHAVVAWLVCLAGLPAWNAALDAVGDGRWGWGTHLALLGALPAAVRLGFGVGELSRG